MSFWIEIHCDVRADGCRSFMGEHPGMLARNNDVSRALRILRIEAQNIKWVHVRNDETNHYDWCCTAHDCRKKAGLVPLERTR